MAIKTSIPFFGNVPAGSIFSIKVAIESGAGPANVKIIDADPTTPDVHGVGSNITRSLVVSAPACAGRVQIEVVDALIGTVTYAVTDPAGAPIQPPVIDVLGTTAEPMPIGDFYSALCFVETP